jgi:hypothetical protein
VYSQSAPTFWLSGSTSQYTCPISLTVSRQLEDYSRPSLCLADSQTCLLCTPHKAVSEVSTDEQKIHRHWQSELAGIVTV